ncbi:MAG: MFS transporter [Chloroflexi bacterium]|nr:MFS transporter [Chloroflexota bacterium]
MIRQEKLLGIDWRIFAFYLFAFAAGGVIQPFLNLYLVEAGLTRTQIGLLQGWTAAAAVIVTPLIGVLTDRLQRHRLMLGVIVLLKGLSAPLMLLSQTWVWLIGTVSLRVVTAQAQDALMNRLTLKSILGTNGRLGFGSVRFWGGFSFAATSILTGWLAKDGSVGVLFPLAGLLGLIAALMVRGFPKSMLSEGEQILNTGPSPRSRQLIIIFVILFLFAAAQSGPKTFAFVYLVDELGARNDLIGLLGALGSLAPLPAFYLADRLILRWGALATMGIGFLCFVLAWGGYALIKNPWLGIPIVVIEGFAAAFQLVGMVILLGRYSLPERGATDQMLAQLTVPGLARILAEPASGYIFEAWGGKILFLLSSLVMFLGIVYLTVVKTYFLEKE